MGFQIKIISMIRKKMSMKYVAYVLMAQTAYRQKKKTYKRQCIGKPKEPGD